LIALASVDGIVGDATEGVQRGRRLRIAFGKKNEAAKNEREPLLSS
jgi:hypothetical protein